MTIVSRNLRAVFLLVWVVATLPVVAAEYRGNRESHVFHEASCRYFNCKNCMVRFSSVEEAIERGFRPCGVCRPSGSRNNLSQTEESYSGNTSSRKFHRASCRYASCKNCTAKFKSRKAAMDAGYSPGGCCRP